jgi:hypothetical protein
MPKRYVYKNVNKRPVNIGGYHFEEGRELESDILIHGFNEAVSNGFLELAERGPDSAEPDATQAPQTGNAGSLGSDGGKGKVTVFFHCGLTADGIPRIESSVLGFNRKIDFPNVDLREGETFEGWFTDAEFTSAPVDIKKAKTPKEPIDVHFYGKYVMPKQDGEADSEQKQDQNPPFLGDDSDPSKGNADSQ